MFVGPRQPGQAPAKPAILVPLAESDYLAVADLAGREGLAMAAYLRSLVRRHLESVKP